MENSSTPSIQNLPDARWMRIGIVVADWHHEVTTSLLEGCREKLVSLGVLPKNIQETQVPGSFELPLGAQYLLNEVDGVICLGCVIKGETEHNNYINQAVAKGLMNLNLKYEKPVIFGLLTTDTLQQAKARAGGDKGHKGVDAALAVVKMVHLGNTGP